MTSSESDKECEEKIIMTLKIICECIDDISVKLNDIQNDINKIKEARYVLTKI